MQKIAEPTSPMTSQTQTRLQIFLIVASIITIIICIVLAFSGFGPAVIMGVVQGIGEFLPISSSAHLILVPWFMGWHGESVDTLTFDIALHAGTLAAVMGYFWRDWLALIRAIPTAFQRVLKHKTNAIDEHPRMRDNADMLIALIIATIPGAIVGKLLQDYVESSFRNPLLLAATLSIVGAILFLVDSRRSQTYSLQNLSWRDALLIGLAQSVAIIPGVSRSGSTMTMARMLNYDRTSAARFSFLMSAPITAAAVLVKLPDMLALHASEFNTFLVGVIVSGAIGALSIHFLLSFIRRIGFGVFAIYRFALAILIIVVAFARM